MQPQNPAAAKGEKQHSVAFANMSQEMRAVM